MIAVTTWLLLSASPAPPGVTATVVVRGDPALVPQVKSALAAGSEGVVQFQLAELPSVNVVSKPGGTAERIAAARKAYVRANFRGCLDSLAGEDRVPALLAEGQRVLAARVLVWRTACILGAGDEPGARRIAGELAAFGLALPDDVGATSPEAEALLAGASRDSSEQVRGVLEVTADIPAARLSLDGRPALCETPCSQTVAPGTHVLVLESDGVVSQTKTVQVAAGATAATHLVTSVATPELAAEQWAVRYGPLSDVESAGSIRLLSIALRAGRLVVLTAEKESDASRLRGVLGIDGLIAARAEKSAPATNLAGSTDALMRDLFVRGKLVEPAAPLRRRWGFWAGIGIAALAAGGTSAALLYEPPRKTEMEW